MKKILSIILSVVLSLNVFMVAFAVQAAELTDTSFKISGTSFVYTGSEIKPTVTFTRVETDPDTSAVISSTTLVENVDYKLAYYDNITTGVGRIVASGMGDYAGCTDYVATFKILPTKIDRPVATASTTSSITISWNALDDAQAVTGYQVFSCDANGENIKKLANTKNTTYKSTGLTAGNIYYYVVRAYTTYEEGKTVYGAYSDVRKYCAKPNTVNIKSVTNSSDKKYITVKWNKVACTGYDIMYSTKSNFSSSKTVRIIGASNVSKKFKLNAKTKYYFKIRAIKAYTTDKYNYGAWSSVSSNSFNKVYSTYSSNYVNNKNRTTNLKIASKAINGTVLQPGETFSFNKVVGKRTTAKGYKDAYIFTGSSSHTMGTGGGVCQVASTIFNAVLLGNFQIVERHQHSQRVTYVPLGRDAAIYWGSEDFKFKNNTSRPVKIFMNVANGKISCTIKVCEDVAPKKVSLKVSRSGNNFTLRRYVGGKVNYTTKSRY